MEDARAMGNEIINEHQEALDQLITQNKDKKYNVAMLILNKKQDVGVFDTKEEAVEALADYKKQYIVSVAESCKGKVQDCVYQAMLNWKVDIAA